MKLLFTSLLSLALVAGSSSTANSQLFKKNKKKTVTKTLSKPKAAYKSIASVTKKCEKFDGLFPIYQDTTTGKMFIEISKEKLGEEFIHFSYVENGVMDAGAFKGSYRGSKIFKINKYYGNIEFTLENTNYYFNPDNEISKSSETNINKPIIISEKIAAKTGDNYLISASSLFLTESFSQIKPKYPPGYRGVRLGGLSKSKTKPLKIKNYPENTDVRSLYVYDNPSGSRRGSAAITSAQSISITYHHSLIAMPDNDFKPRRDDPRLGYFMTQVTDQTSASVTPYRDMIHRWNLVKKNPEAAMSEPVKPITWWIENTTPKELRPIIKEGVEQWNLAFEKAGFKNAVVVNIQPDDADWDAGDIRYNVLRWTSTPAPPFGGYGPSFVNPRTGEILGADIMLEYVYILGRIRQEKMFEQAGLGIMETAEELLLDNHDHQTCMVGTMMQEDVFFGNTSMDLLDLTGVEKNRFLRESIQRLVLHEVGHTLGLNHNMKGSSIQSVEDLKNEAKMKQEGMCNSVMEYPSINFALNKNEQTYYYDDKPGLYDHWVIEYGYSQGLDDAEEEEKRLTKILARSTDPKLVFGNDADDMRSPGKAIDPRVMIGDLSNDQIGYSIDRIQLSNNMMKDIKTRFGNSGESYMQLRQAYYILSGQSATAAGVISRFIGGVYVDRTKPGQNGETMPYTPVSLEDQKRAMNALKKYVFAPDAFKAPADLYNYLAQQRRGYNFFGGPEDPKIHEQVLSYQTRVLAHITHPNTLKRISNSELYGNEYKLSTYMTDLNNAIFKGDIKGSVNSFRQNLQATYTKGLISIISGKSSGRYPIAAKSMAIYNLKNIQNWVSNTTGNIATKAHKNHLKTLITNAMKEIK